jgi:hypothetical protein
VRDGIWLVLHFDAKKRGSMEQQLVALAERLRGNGVPLTYVFARKPAPFPGDALRALGVDVRALPFEQPLRAPEQLALWLRKAAPALVHFNFVRAYSPLVAVAKLSGARVAVHEHVTLIARHDAPRLRLATKAMRDSALNWMADRRIAVSRFVAESVVAADHVPAGRVTVVENGIDLSRFAQVDGAPVALELGLEGAPLIACVARFNPEKGAGRRRAGGAAPPRHRSGAGRGRARALSRPARRRRAHPRRRARGGGAFALGRGVRALGGGRDGVVASGGGDALGCDAGDRRRRRTGRREA